MDDWNKKPELTPKQRLDMLASMQRFYFHKDVQKIRKESLEKYKKDK